MVLLAIGAGAAYCLGDRVAGKFFPLKQVVVSGGEQLPEGLVESVIAQSVPKGTCLLLFNGRSLCRRLEEETKVGLVLVQRRLPSTLVVKLVEREPLALVRQGNRQWLCNREGIVLEQKGEMAKGLPVVEVSRVSLRSLSPGTRIADPQLKDALRALSFLRAGGTEVPEKVFLSPERGMEIRFAGGTLLRLGAPSRLEEKLGLCLAVLQKRSENSRISLVDVSCPDYSYYEVVSR
jgi:cell division protein FtsQ